MKNIYLILFAFLSATLAKAQTFTSGGINYNVTDAINFKVQVGGNSIFSGAANIPTTVLYNSNSYEVTRISSGAFYNNIGLTSVIIPNSVTSIENNAFYRCTGLTSVIIPDSVTRIEDYAFIGCTGLTSINIPNSLTTIKTFVFTECTALTSISIPNTVTIIGSYAFSGCYSLTSIIIPNSVTNIEPYAFYGCKNVQSLTLPNTISTIKMGTFQFLNSLTSLTIPNSVIHIENDAFRFCTNVTSLIIPNSVTTIGSFAFASFYRLPSVVLPNSITSIGNGAFGYIFSLNSFTVNWATPLPIVSGVFQGTTINGKVLNVPSGTGALYEASPVWTDFNIVGGEPRGCWAEISAGGQHTLAIAQDGRLWAWGNQDFGQLGNNSTSGNVLNPLLISNEPNWAFVSAGEFYSLAIKKDGTLWACGDNTYGQLGNGTTTQQNVPVQIGTASNWVGVYAGYDHSMARKADNSLWAWGDNSFGKLGNGNTTQQNIPIQVGSFTNWQTVSLGRTHTVALRSNGQLWSWGQNNYGQLGIGNTTNQLSPIQIGNDTSWKAIEAGGDYHCIALKNNGTIYSWGENGSGQLGLGDTTNRNSPTQIGSATDWSSIATGLYSGYATKSAGTLWAWGDNFKGQLGNGNFTQQNSPVQVGTNTNWDLVIAGNEYVIAQNESGTFYSWGDNQSGQLGNGATLPNTTGQNIPGVMGCAGNILAFDGVDDRIIIANTGAGILGDNSTNESYTIEMKVKLNSIGLNKLFSKKTSTPSNLGFTIETDASGILIFDQAYNGIFSRTQTSTSLSANTWYRIVTTFDYVSKTHKLYLDGTLVDSNTETGTPNFGISNSGIGYSYGDESGRFDGQMNDLRVWNIARTPTDILSYSRNSQAQTNASNLLVHFKFNQGIANANNAGLTVLANEVVGGPIGTLQNFALTGSTSNWSNDITASETLSTNNFSIIDKIKMYPNPSNGIFTVNLEEDASVEVRDMLGKVIYTNKIKSGNNTIDISNYQSGIYLLNISNENGSVIKKLIKE